jgi:hypothetical protein
MFVFVSGMRRCVCEGLGHLSERGLKRASAGGEAARVALGRDHRQGSCSSEAVRRRRCLLPRDDERLGRVGMSRRTGRSGVDRLPHGTIMVKGRVRGDAEVSCGTRDRSASERDRDLRVVGVDVMTRSTAATLQLRRQSDQDSAERVSPASVFVGTRTGSRRSTTAVSEAGGARRGHEAGMRVRGGALVSCGTRDRSFAVHVPPQRARDLRWWVMM